MLGTAVRLAAAASALSWVARAARRHPPLAAAAKVVASISVIVPARNEAVRIDPLLRTVIGAPGVSEVLVVDDESTDATAEIARRAGATVIAGRPLPAGWVGKAWALHQGIEAATGEWLVMLDADTRPSPELPGALVARCIEGQLDLLTVAGRFDCPTAPLRWLHPALLTTLVYRSAPPGAVAAGPVRRRMGNGQCLAARRATLVDAGALGVLASHTVEDVALVRMMAAAGFGVGFLDASSLLTVRMYETAIEAWGGWSRSLSLPDVDTAGRRVVELLVVALAQGLPFVRLLARRADLLDVTLLAVRLGTLVGTAPAYTRRGVAYWLSPLADPLAIAALARGVADPRRSWRGRSY